MANEEMKELDEFGEVTEELAGALAAASPHRLPPDLRARVLRAAEMRAGRAGRVTLGGAGAWARGLAVAAALVLVVGLLVWNLQLQQGLADERTLLQQLRDNAKESVIFEVVDSPGSQRISLKAVGPQRPGEDPPYGKVYTNPSQTQIVAMAGRLPSPDANGEYHLYLTDRIGAIVHAGTISVDAAGFGYLIYETGGRGPAYSAARLYLQPRGSSSPGGTLVLLFPSS
jgi:hypothetical protein